MNPLASRGGHERQPWFPCSCCPPNVARLIGGLERYLVTKSAAALHIQQFADCAVDFLKGQKGDRPFLCYVAFNAPHDPRLAPKEYHCPGLSCGFPSRDRW